MTIDLNLIIALGGFLVVSVAAAKISKFFPRIKLPIITGLLLIGIVSGPFFFKLIPKESVPQLNFINEIALAFIAFAAGAELYMKELHTRFRSIKWMTFGQLTVTFMLGGGIVLLLGSKIPFMQRMTEEVRIAVALMVGTIFVARSPVSAIAVINEMRAKGPFTQTAMGVTVLKDVLVIVLFTLCFAISDALIEEIPFDVRLIGILILELSISFLLGLGLFLVLRKILAASIITWLKSVMILLVGFSVYRLANGIHVLSIAHLGFDFYVEPLLICIIGSFMVVNYSRYRREFHKIVELIVPMVYVVFFTLTGASISLDILLHSWGIALLFFSIRFVCMMIGAFIGGTLGGDPMHYNRISWMPYVTQAGVALGLVAVVANKYPSWGAEFSTIMIAVIVLNQIVGPPLFKWSILHVGESHLRGEPAALTDVQNALIFGLEGQSLALARQLLDHNWKVRVMTRNKEKASRSYSGIQVDYIRDFSLSEMERIGAHKADAMVLMNRDDDNLKVCELAYEKFGTRDLVVRVHDRSHIRRFVEMGAQIVDPSTAMVGLLDHLVRSPMATSLLLGMDQGQDTVDVPMQNPDMQGVPLRDIQLPDDILILATKRNNNKLISTGYTRLRIGDVITIVGSVESIEKVKLRMAAMPKMSRKRKLST